MKHKFQINRGIESPVVYKEVDITIGESYLCISSYRGYSGYRKSNKYSVFTEGKYYKLIEADTFNAFFIDNGGNKYQIYAYADGMLFNIFNFEYTLTRYNREEKIDIILE